MLKHIIILGLVLISVSGCCSKKVDTSNKDSNAKSVLAMFEMREGYHYFEFTDPNTIAELQNFVNEITDAGCSERMQIAGDHTSLYFFDSGKCDTLISIYAQPVSGIGGKRDFKWELLGSQYKKKGNAV